MIAQAKWNDSQRFAEAYYCLPGELGCQVFGSFAAMHESRLKSIGLFVWFNYRVLKHYLTKRVRIISEQYSNSVVAGV